MILIVDECFEGAISLATLLKRMGYSAACFPDPLEALDLMRALPQGTPLLMLLDHILPGMSGIEFLRLLRKDPATRNTQVVMFSAGFTLSVRQQATPLGVRAWLIKGEDITTSLKLITQEYQLAGGVPTPPSNETAHKRCLPET